MPVALCILRAHENPMVCDVDYPTSLLEKRIPKLFESTPKMSCVRASWHDDVRAVYTVLSIGSWSSRVSLRRF